MVWNKASAAIVVYVRPPALPSLPAPVPIPLPNASMTLNVRRSDPLASRVTMTASSACPGTYARSQMVICA